MFSVIIPTLNEEKYLGRLLKTIKAQKLQPAEIIVSDNDSTDRTRKIAKKFGCKIVDGGIPSVARNKGAEAATQDILIFLDADTELLSNGTFNQIIGRFLTKDADIGSCYATNVTDEDSSPSASHLAFNTTKRLNTVTSKTVNSVLAEGGFSIVVKRSFYKKIGGFDEKKRVMEDSEFFQRAVKKGGKYVVIPVKIGVSDRRFSKRDFSSSLRLAALVPLVVGGMFLGIKGWQKTLDKYEAEKGGMGGKKGSDPDLDKFNEKNSNEGS